VQQVEQPLPTGQGHRRVEPGVHHAGRGAGQHGHAQHEPEARRGRVPGGARGGAQAGHGQQGGHAQAPDQRTDEGGDQHGADRADQQDQAEVTDRSPEGDAHGGPRGAEHAVGQAQDDEVAETEQVRAPAGRGRRSRPALLIH